MPNDEARTHAAAAMRDLNHAFAAHDPADDELDGFAARIAEHTAGLSEAPRRDRMALMRASAAGGVFPTDTRAGFEDRVVAGKTNPTSVDIDVRFEADQVFADVVLRRAFEGAPGRAHGGIVAAAFDDVTGFVIGMIHQPAFTGELTVRYLAPVPVDEPLEMRAWLRDRERRKLFIEAECRHGDQLVAVCHAIYISVDPSMFAGAPDPR